MKRLLTILALPLCLALVSCNEDEYNADTAESYYQPYSGARRVASLKTTFVENGNESVHEHNFQYDAKGRIKSINSNSVIYTSFVMNNNGFKDTVDCRGYMTSAANYFYRGEGLEVAYNVSIEYPDYPSMNGYYSTSAYGVFKQNGVLDRFSQLSFDYSSTMLQRAYVDGGTYVDVTRDSDGNVTGYRKCEMSGEVHEDKSDIYLYLPITNRTNFDFSAYFGYWGVEQSIPDIRIPYRAPYQLAAFGMIGSTSKYLPWGVKERGAGGEYNEIKGEWELDENNIYPLSFVDPYGRRTEITYYK